MQNPGAAGRKKRTGLYRGLPGCSKICAICSGTGVEQSSKMEQGVVRKNCTAIRQFFNNAACFLKRKFL
ncbi:MAG: hypothetical protein CVU89_11235 [Firmicutes bacterium HGW-Firmicutes-14]|nr:MAG: hypothetical protein CVU89_11235 [Firmicutes bacterium HGW-Firmicutes-14]